MDLEKYYLHAIDSNDGSRFNDERALMKMEQILKSGYLLSRRKQGDIEKNKGGWNGLDYISLCDYSKKDSEPFEKNPFYKGYTAYETYVKSSLSLILNKKGLKVIKPILMPPAVFDWDSLEEMRYLGNHPSQRFSDMPDELQVKNSISLKRIEGITIPILYMIDEKYKEVYSKDMIVEFLLELKNILVSYGIEVPIYDLSTSILLQDANDVAMVLELNSR